MADVSQPDLEVNTEDAEPSRACLTKRRRSREDIEDIKRTIVDVLKNDHPMTVRQVFYQLVVRAAIEKTEDQYQGTVIRLMAQMRIDGLIPYAWIVDESRRVRITQTFNNIEDALAHTAQFYRRSALDHSPDYVETPYRASCGTPRQITMSL